MISTARRVWTSPISLVVAGLLCLPPMAEASSLLKVGDSGAVGNIYNWNFNALTDVAPGAQVGYSFTAFEDVTIDAIKHRIELRDAGVGEQVTVAIHADSAGTPGAVLASRTYAPSSTATIETNPLSNAVNLTAGSVYHVTLTNATVNGTGTIRMFHNGPDHPVRTYDNRLDPAGSVIVNTGGGWVSQNHDPYFSLSNGGVGVAGPGAPITTQLLNSTFTSDSRFGQNLLGQTFTISDGEIPVGTQFEVSSIDLTLRPTGAPPPTLFVRLRSVDEQTILATAQIDTATLANAANEVTLTFDTTALLDQGTQYLITTDYNGVDTGSTPGGVFIRGQIINGGVEGARSNYGGVDLGAAVRSTDNWATVGTFGNNTFDLEFGLNGVVVPEPGSVGLIGLGLLLMISRRGSS